MKRAETIVRRRKAAKTPKGAGVAVLASSAAADSADAPERRNITTFFGFENIEKVFGLCEQVLERRWSVSDVGVPYRWINYWDRERLLLDIEREGTSWRKFSFIDYIWVRMICELREFGLSFDAIRRVKDALAAPLPVEPEVALRKTRERSSYNILLLLIAEAVVTKAPIHLLVRCNGETLLFNENHAGLYGQELDRFRAGPHLCVPLTGMLGEIVRRNAIDFIAPKIPLLTPSEVEVLTLLRQGALTELEAIGENDQPIKIIADGAYDRAESERMLIERMMLRPYRQVRYETKDGKTVSFRAQARETAH